jgi:hypothetical protein
MTDTADSVRSEMTEQDWLDVSESEFVDFVEGRRSIGLVFEHDVIGLHGFKFDPRSGILRPVSFSKFSDSGEEDD